MKKNKECRESLKKEKCCLLIPTYNNARLIGPVIREALEYCDDIIVVNDGCTDNTAEILSGFQEISVVEHSANRGKGHALKTGFQGARELGFDNVITLDSDGQHSPADIPRFLQYLGKEEACLVIGSRKLQQENVPGKNRFANRFSSFWYFVETGIKLKDTQSGFRLYPLDKIKKIKTLSGRFGFELEVLVKSAWKGLDVNEVPIRVYYAPGKERISHFRPFTDFMLISLLNIWLVFLALLYYRPSLTYKKYRRKGLKQIFREDIIGSDSPRIIIACSIGFGIFMGIFPAWGYQLIIGFVIVHFLKLNKAIFFIAANISLPPMIPLILYLSYVTGSYVLGKGSWIVDVELNLESIALNLKQYLLGSIVFASIAGGVMLSLSYALLLLFKRKS